MTQGDHSVLASQNSTNKDNFHILREEVYAAIRSLKKGKSAGMDEFPAELIQHGGQIVTEIFTRICKHDLTDWRVAYTTDSLIITLPKKGNL